MKLPVVALVGKPNVGKSTLFNKIVGKQLAITENISGVTRDRLYSDATYLDYKFKVIDTGGITLEKNDFNADIKLQAEIAITEADVIIFIVDGIDGLTKSDLAVRDILRKSQKRIIVAINKIDNKEASNNIYDFYELGFDTYIPISSIHNTGYIDLLDQVVLNFPKIESNDIDTNLHLAVIGRPNVGKSSLINALLNEERNIVSNIAGTTRDSVDSTFKYNNEEYTIIDTAGLRKKGKVFEAIEKYSLLRSLKAIDRSDICLLVINAEEGIIEHDKHIAGYAIEKGVGLIIVVNKWDTIIDPDTNQYTKLIRSEFQFAPFAPIVFVSAKTKKRLTTIMPEVLRVKENIIREIKTSDLNNTIRDAYDENLPPSYKQKRLKIYFVNQINVKPPKFVFHVNDKGLVHFSYYRYLENKLREKYDFTGTPIIIDFKNRGEE